MPKDSKPVNLRLILVLGTAVLLLGVQVLGLFSNITTPLERIEFSMVDTFTRLRGVDEPSGEIVIVAIDDASFSWTGLQWPWPRSNFAEVVDQINQGGGKVVGVDIFLSEPDTAENDQAFVEALVPDYRQLNPKVYR